MGHTWDVHKDFYRQYDPVGERLDVAKLLMLQDQNKLNDYRDKNLGEIDVERLARAQFTDIVRVPQFERPNPDAETPEEIVPVMDRSSSGSPQRVTPSMASLSRVMSDSFAAPSLPTAEDVTCDANNNNCKDVSNRHHTTTMHHHHHQSTASGFCVEFVLNITTFI